MKVKLALHKEPVSARQDIKETNVNYALKDFIFLEITCLKNALVCNHLSLIFEGNLSNLRKY